MSGLAKMNDNWVVSPYNFDSSVRSRMHLPDQVRVMDMTLREGRQVAGVSLRLEDVLEFARRLDMIGIQIIEMMRDDPDEIREVKKLGINAKVQALIHPSAALNPAVACQEIDECQEAGADIVCLSLAVSDHTYRIVESPGIPVDREDAIRLACRAVEYGKKQGITVSSLLMDFSRMDLDLLRVMAARLAEAGSDIIRLDDICAPCIPAVYEYHCWQIKQVIGNAQLAIHTHDDFDLGIAGQLAALQGGADILEGCVNGLGERAGVPNLAVLCALLEGFYGYDTGIRLDRFQELSAFVADVWNQPLPPHIAGVGKTAFSHADESHYAFGIEGNEWAFNAWSPSVLGNSAYIPLCHYSGPMSIARKAQQLGLGGLTYTEAETVLAKVRSELRLRKTELSDELFGELVYAVRPKRVD